MIRAAWEKLRSPSGRYSLGFLLIAGMVAANLHYIV